MDLSSSEQSLNLNPKRINFKGEEKEKKPVKLGGRIA